MSPPSEESNTESPNRWYLAYGSNLSSQTFRGRRGIRPLAQTNVLVPSLELTFDLPGLPYWEPCFANVRERKNILADAADSVSVRPGFEAQGEFEDPESKTPQLIGVAYLVTPEDFAHIVATEGGGASYQVVDVECWPLPGVSRQTEKSIGDEETKTGISEKAKQDDPMYVSTLLAPDSGRRAAPLQPSKRYINILRAGARENDMPFSYIAYLDSLPYYRITSLRQRAGSILFMATWLPPLLVIILLQKLFADSKTGRTPKWLADLSLTMRSAMWQSYDSVWKKIFGSGETTVDRNTGVIDAEFTGASEETEFKEVPSDAISPHLDFMGR